MDVVVLARFLLTGIAILLAALAVATWNRRNDAPEATLFSAIMVAMAVYVFGYAGEIAQTNLAAAQRWLDVEYLVLPWVPGLWLLAVGRQNGLRMRSGLLFVIPLITFVGHFANWHHLFYTGPMRMVERPPFRVLTVERGPLSILDNAYLLVAFLAGAWIYVSRLRHASSLFRKQATVLVLSSFVPFVGYFAYLAGLSPYGLDTAPVTLGATCWLFYYGIFHCGIFDLAPLARSLIFNGMRDAVLILDSQQRLLDFNPAAAALLPVLQKRRIGQEASDVLQAFPEVLNAVLAQGLSSEFHWGTGDDSQSFEVRNWPLETRSTRDKPRVVGRAVILSDVTSQVRLREELRRNSETDALTGVPNRRRFHQALEVECYRYGRGRAPLSVMMIDLDKFKDVNDRFGHLAGDAVLSRVAQVMQMTLRKTDLLARYGGEEFAVLLPETKLEGALVIAERVRRLVDTQVVQAESHSIHVTISVGVTSHAHDKEVEPHILLKKADLALYRAKTLGRNRVEAS